MFAVPCMLALMCFGCDDMRTRIKDVTNDPSYGGFSSVVGTWRTKSQLTLMEIDKTLYLSTTGEHYSATTRDLAILPVSTEIRLERLNLKTTIETQLLYATGSLTSGPYAGRTFEVDDRIFLPNFFKPPNTATPPSTPLEKKWTVAPDKLEK